MTKDEKWNERLKKRQSGRKNGSRRACRENEAGKLMKWTVMASFWISIFPSRISSIRTRWLALIAEQLADLCWWNYVGGKFAPESVSELTLLFSKGNRVYKVDKIWRLSSRPAEEQYRVASIWIMKLGYDLDKFCGNFSTESRRLSFPPICVQHPE